MGTRGAFGVIIGEQEKIAYNQYDSYPEGKGVEVLRWIRDADLTVVRDLAEKAKVVSEDSKPTPEDVKALKPYTNLGVSEQSTDDWYCLVRETQGDLGMILESGYVLDASHFPLDSLFCEWAYIIDLDAGRFEVYKGFQKKLPKEGRWKRRPTKAEDEENWAEHLKWCARQTPPRTPWMKERSEYKAVELVASWPLDDLPTEEHFLGTFELINARRSLDYVKEYPDDVAAIVNRIVDQGLGEPGKPFAKEWADLEEEARTLLTKHSSPGQVRLLLRLAGERPVGRPRSMGNKPPYDSR